MKPRVGVTLRGLVCVKICFEVEFVFTEKDGKNFTRLQYVGDALKSCEYSN